MRNRASKAPAVLHSAQYALYLLVQHTVRASEQPRTFGWLAQGLVPMVTSESQKAALTLWGTYDTELRFLYGLILGLPQLGEGGLM